ECLTGRPPFRGATRVDTLDQVRFREPVPPTALQPKVPRDLETVCLKCLQKEPKKRYASAEALADDLRRFLDGRPILARPVGPLERGAKWARRRPAVAALSALVILVSAIGLATVLWKWHDAVAARREAEDLAGSEKELRGVVEDREREKDLYLSIYR